MHRVAHHASGTGARHRPRTSPTALGPYSLHERLGAGGAATVFRATRTDDPSATAVAIKRLHPHLVPDAHAVAAFVKEARIGLLLDHPAVRRVFALCREADELFLVMEYVEGESLLHLLRSASAGRRTPHLAGALTILCRLCDVLHYAHELVDEHGEHVRFVHRDITPSNLILTLAGQLKVIDMGVARARVGDPATQTGTIKGKYGYMAPEMLARQRFDRRADVYSLGVVAWELLTGHKLFAVAGDAADVDAVRRRRIAPPSAFNSMCSPALDAAVVRALAASPAERYPTAAAFCDALRAVAAPLPGFASDQAVVGWIHGYKPSLAGIPQPRMARGTRPPVQPAEPAAPTTTAIARGPSASRRSLGLGIVLGSLATTLGAVLLSSACPATALPRAAPVPRAPPAAASADAGRPPDATAPEPEMVRVGGPLPRSRGSQAPYRARLCVDVDGRVTSIDILEAPARLHGRIRRALRQWRYEPVGRDVCFEVASRLRKPRS